jgi:peroxiredoxin Q/BCP
MSKITDLPSFSVKDDEGNEIKTSDLLGRPLVIFFYPKDFTAGCTAEVCSFRDAYQDFEDVNATVLGVSQDDEQSHQKFIQKHNLPFRLLTDDDKALQKLFGVKGDLFGLIPGRETFVFSSQGKLIHHFKSQIKVEKHVMEALEAIRKAEAKSV